LPSLREWLETSNPRTLALGAVAFLIVLIGAVLLVDSRSGSTGSTASGPRASAAKPQAGSVAARPVGPDGLIAPATAADSGRVAQHVGVPFQSGARSGGDGRLGPLGRRISCGRWTLSRRLRDAVQPRPSDSQEGRRRRRHSGIPESDCAGAGRTQLSSVARD